MKSIGRRIILNVDGVAKAATYVAKLKEIIASIVAHVEMMTPDS